jgi:hypothetical protein
MLINNMSVFCWCKSELHAHTNIPSRVGYVTWLITSHCQEGSGYLLCFTYTLMHFTIMYFSIIPLVLCVLLSWLTSSVVVALSLWAYVGVLRTGYETPFAKVRSRVRQSVASETSRLIRCYSWTFHLWGNVFVITLPWKFLLQTHYNTLQGNLFFYYNGEFPILTYFGVEWVPHASKLRIAKYFSTMDITLPSGF